MKKRAQMARRDFPSVFLALAVKLIRFRNSL